MILEDEAEDNVTKTANKHKSFPDGAKVSSWAAEAMGWTTSQGIINGKGDGRLADREQ
ncbi:MAG: S-layer homology domain-containing protein [Lachnospiraceae bacterium]|nr:S-layer homology domain-containing protein [Lachnospiraceae bacterium]